MKDSTKPQHPPTGHVDLEDWNDLYADAVKATQFAAADEGLDAWQEWHDQPVTARLSRAELLATPEAERLRTLEAYIAAQAASVLKLTVSRLGGRTLPAAGLDSLGAVELARRLEVDLGTAMPMVIFLQDEATAHTVAAGVLQRFGMEGAAGADATAVPPLVRGAESEEGEHPLSYGQRALWFLQQLEPTNTAYNIVFAVRVTSALDREALERSLTALVARHAALRTVYPERDHQPVQVVQPAGPFALTVIDAQQATAAELDAQLLAATHRPFDLEQGPVFRAEAFIEAGGTHVLVLTAHHIAFDFWSLEVLMDELRVVYAAELTGTSTELAPLPLTYRDYARWQIEALGGAHGAKLLAYWQEELAGAPTVLPLPLDKPRPPVQTFRGFNHVFRLDAALGRRVKQLAQVEGVTLFTLLLAAYQTLLWRYTGQDDVLVASPAANRTQAYLDGIVGYFADPVVLRGRMAGALTFRDLLKQVKGTVLRAIEHQDCPFPLLVEKLQVERDPSLPPLVQTMFVLEKPQRLAALGEFFLGGSGAQMEVGPLSLTSVALPQSIAQFDVTLMVTEAGEELIACLQVNADLFEAETAARMGGHLATLLAAAVEAPATPLAQLPLLTAAEREELLGAWNETETADDEVRGLCIHELFERQAARTPEKTAIVFEGEALSYRTLDARANALAHQLRALGVGPDVRVGVSLRRSAELIVSLLAVFKAGGAYVPLDPAYPQERLDLIVADARPAVLLTSAAGAERFQTETGLGQTVVVSVDGCTAEHLQAPTSEVTPSHLAYMIYTSGSTGTPKGVMVEHRQVTNFFLGMDERVGCGEDDVMLAVTSVSFDISVLELFWTLVRGAKVVVLSEQESAGGLSRQAVRTGNGMAFSLFYFASDQGEDGAAKYRLLLEGAKYADQHGFTAVWTPERHFHEFGGLYPNPSVMSAALAMVTERIELRAGSVVLPLHNPIRVAEEWAVVDNLSNGRVSLSFAAGWNSDDFVLMPEQFATRNQALYEGIATVQKLWRGESLPFTGGSGQQVLVSTLPRPVQPELPIWVTSGGNPQTFIDAGKIGANLLTHLLGQSVEDLTAKIALYRQSRAEHGHDPETGRVALMLHTYVGTTLDEVRETVREPFTNYLRSSVGLFENLLRTLHPGMALQDLSAADMDDLAVFAFDRYFETSGLFGTPATCLAFVDKLKGIGVDEVACLVDFGVEVETALAGFEQLNALRALCVPHVEEHAEEQADYSIAAQAIRHGATLFQCTPTLMKMLGEQEGALPALSALRAVLLGGEALPVALATRLRAQLPQTRLVNMYGPTEATVWATTYEVVDAADLQTTVPIGKPFANLLTYVLDATMQPVPIGVPGELYIGGRGVARGYWERAELTAERFVIDPFAGPLPDAEPRLYRTGDLVRWQADGTLEFLGRLDHQVKLRGFRIELGEIEAALGRVTGVDAAVAVVREDVPGDQRLVGYVQMGAGQLADEAQVRDALRATLPEHMIPSAFVVLDAFPLTPNGKIDRKALPAPTGQSVGAYLAPRTPLEAQVAAIWSELLNYAPVGVQDAFFLRGGHSLLATQLISRIRETFDVELTLRRFFEMATVEGLAQAIVDAQGDEQGEAAALAALLAELDELSDEEAARLLAGDNADNDEV